MVHWYKRDPDAALAGMAQLTPDERGAYNTIIDLLYSRDGHLPDDDRLLLSHMNCHGNEWRSLKRRLLASGKVWIVDGLIHAKRVDEALEEAAKLSETQRIRAGKRWETHRKRSGNGAEIQTISNNINGSSMPVGNPSTSTTTPTKEEEVPKAGQSNRYAFDGKVVRLTQKDLDKWVGAFPQLDLIGELTARDAWLASEAKGDDLKKWFMSTAKYLANRNMEAKSKIKEQGAFHWKSGIEGVV